MDQNPYQSPQSPAEPAAERIHTAGWKLFLLGCGIIAPASWLLGRTLIAPDDVATRFSQVAYPVLVTAWGLFLFTRHRLAALASRVFGRLPRA